MKYVCVSGDMIGHFLVGNLRLHNSIGNAYLTPGEFMLALDDDGNVLFMCKPDDIWQSWCKRQLATYPDWCFESIEFPHFMKLLERWIRFCIHRGATQAGQDLPRRLLGWVPKRDTHDQPIPGAD